LIDLLKYREVLAEEIIKNIEAGLHSFKDIKAALNQQDAT